ncbi:12-(S)-hydroxy-5,8,10,14-eicosatetraenoic acid receptor [Gopherus flavomarginatus]|uniref:12-(S)-hydroxy-5,8,10,14-eicosatetraenoic acid receptor n=1 Tax=Gopherus flavomarginatus TaxID=286002 RepID=UPI0021CBA9EE|nr:12-(S)-hydroxy-5,8,10,14-eicosatetraenoic acid receptor [Gopherus flavomarginatus]
MIQTGFSFSVLLRSQQKMTNSNCSVYNEAVEIAMNILLILEFLLGLTSNAIALWTFYFRLKIWKPHTVYLLNLVIADVLLSICLPFRLVLALRFSTIEKWDYRDLLCSVIFFALSLSQAVSIAFLTAVALDRYFRVVHPNNKTSFLTARNARVIACLVWLLAIGLTAEILVAPRSKNSTECCSFTLQGEANFYSIWHVIIFFLKFLVPFGLILFCTVGVIRKLKKSPRELSSQPKLQKAMLLVIAVVVVFGVCFLPSVLGRVLVYILQSFESCAAFRFSVNVFDVTICWTYLNSTLDPIVYCFSSPTFRSSYRKIFNSLRMRRNEVEPQSLDISKDSES